VLVHAVRTPEERAVHLALLQRLRRRGARLSVIAWDRGLVAMDLDELGPVHEIEDINRWRLPQALARVGLRVVARQLRQQRVRSWWRRDGLPDAVLVLGPVRPEMAHYLPDGSGPVGLIVGWRAAEGAEDLAATLALVDHVLASGERRAEVAGAEARVRTVDEVVAAHTPAGGGDVPDAVVGLGPDDWRGAPDLFLRAVARLDPAPGELAWGGVDPEDGRSFPYRFDADQLGVDGIGWLPDPVDVLDVVARAAVVVVTGRAPIPLHPLVDDAGPAAFFAAAGLPVVGFDTPAMAAVSGPGTATVGYPDVAALTDAVARRLAEAAPADVDGVLDDLLDALLAPDDP
jgi:hypothetical protein